MNRDQIRSAPRFSVGEYTTRRLSFTEDLALYRDIGVDGIGIDAGLKLRGEHEELAAFRASGLQATFCFPSTPSILPLPQLEGTDRPVARIEEMCAGLSELAPYDPIACVCVTGPQADYTAHQARALVVSGLREAAQAAGDLGMTLAIEPMHLSLKDDWSLVTTLPETIDLIDEVGEANLKVMFDIWHLWDTPDLLKHIRDHAARFAGVQVNDWRAPTRSWCDRVLPGDGIADIPGILAALDDGGYSDWFELEIFSDDSTFGLDFADSLWRRDPAEVIREGRDKFLDLWNSRHRGTDLEGT